MLNFVPEESQETQELQQENPERASSSEETEMDDSDNEEIPVVRSYVLVGDTSATSIIPLSHLSLPVEAQWWRHGECGHQLQHHPQYHAADVRRHHGGGLQARLPGRQETVLSARPGVNNQSNQAAPPCSSYDRVHCPLI